MFSQNDLLFFIFNGFYLEALQILICKAFSFNQNKNAINLFD